VSCHLPRVSADQARTRYSKYEGIADVFRLVPVAAGMERDGRTPLYFACAWHEGLRVPGYSGPNTRGARIPFGGSEITVQEDYEVLVWRNNPDRLGG
jgi:hypothetical protein